MFFLFLVGRFPVQQCWLVQSQYPCIGLNQTFCFTSVLFHSRLVFVKRSFTSLFTLKGQMCFKTKVQQYTKYWEDVFFNLNKMSLWENTRLPLLSVSAMKEGTFSLKYNLAKLSLRCSKKTRIFFDRQYNQSL